MVTQLDVWLNFILSPVMEIFYFGIFTGIFIIVTKNNLPNKADVYIGKRTGTILELHTHKQPSDSATEINSRIGLERVTYLLDNTMVQLRMRHLGFTRPVYIYDEDFLTQIKTTKPNGVKVTVNGEDKIIPWSEATDTEKKTGNKVIYPIAQDIETLYHISARKVYAWHKGKMLITSWQALIYQKIQSNLGSIILGAALGGLAVGAYFLSSPHVVTIVTTTTKTIQSYTNTTSVSVNSVP